jgi:nitroreductase
MGGFDREKAKELFDIPEDYQIGVMIAIGYQDTHDLLPDKYKENSLLPRERKPLSEIVFLEEIGKKINI